MNSAITKENKHFKIGGSESKPQEVKNDSILSQSLIVDNEIKITNNDEQWLLVMLVVIQLLMLVFLVLESIIKAAKKMQQRDIYPRAERIEI